jgi:AraC-like DNA-binding protein
MAIHLPENSAPSTRAYLPRLDAAIQLKADLIHKIAASSMRHWRQHLADFVAALVASDVQEKIALLVLLAEARQELRAFAGLGKSGNAGIVALFDTRGDADPSVADILARFQAVVANDLRLSVGSIATPDVVKRAMRLVEAHYAQPITIARVAASVGRSRKHLGMLFKQHVGVTVHEYLVRVRLRHAIRLIRDDEKIEVASLLVGYRSKKNFYRHFKSRMGVTPSAYRTAAQTRSARRKHSPRTPTV